MKFLRWLVIVSYFFLATWPLVWLVMTSFKHKEETISSTATFLPAFGGKTDGGGVFFHVTTAGYRLLTRPHTGVSYSFFHYLGNSMVIGLISTPESCIAT